LRLLGVSPKTRSSQRTPHHAQLASRSLQHVAVVASQLDIDWRARSVTGIASESGNVTETVHAHRNEQFASWQSTSRARPSPARGGTTTDQPLTERKT
jgi:hypothetical protein